MHDGCLVYTLFDRDDLVYSGRCDSLLLDDRLDCFMYVMVNVLSCDGSLVLLGPLDRRDMLDVLVFRPHRFKLLTVFGKHVGITLADDLWEDVVLMLGGLDLVGLDRLHAVLVMFDMKLPVDGCKWKGMEIRFIQSPRD